MLFGLVVTSTTLMLSLGYFLTSPKQQTIGSAPQWLKVEEIQFSSNSSAIIHGWYSEPKNARATVVLLHPIGGNRRSMISRAKFLTEAEIAVLMIDFQAHGESIGKRITFGHLESMDAIAAVNYMRKLDNTKPIVVLGHSLGGAAALLAELNLDADGLILEAVFPDIEIALRNRLDLRMGTLGAFLEPVLTPQIEYWAGVDPEILSPISKAPLIEVPVLIISGAEDRRTTATDTRTLFETFQSDKALWLVAGAQHVNLHSHATEEYERRVLKFIEEVITRSKR